MDFKDLDLKSASIRGSWVHLEKNYREDDATPLYEDEKNQKPCRIHLRGMAEPSVADAIRNYTRIDTLLKDAMGKADKEIIDDLVKGYEPRIAKAIEAVIVIAADKWENIQWDGKPLEFNPENVLKICGTETLFFAQVRDAILEHRRLF